MWIRSRDWFKHRALLHIHDKVIGTSSVFKVNFDTDFDKFGANVAFALREWSSIVPTAANLPVALFAPPAIS